MDRRSFLKWSSVSCAVAGALLKSDIASGRGIPAKVLGDQAPGACYASPANGVIETSLTDFFKIGPGPSSSHTLAPLRISSDFMKAVEALPRDVLEKAFSIEVRLFGSLSATGRGHRTDRAVLAGLLGQKPETCDPELMDKLGDTGKKHATTVNGKTLQVSGDTIVWDAVEHDYPYSNTMILRLVGKDGSTVFEREYYSTGGGFFQWKGQPATVRGKPAHPFGSMAEFKQLLRETGKPLHELILDNEKAIMGVGEQEILAHLDMVLETMEKGVDQGLAQEGLLPAPFEFHRKAKRIHEHSKNAAVADAFMKQVSSYALAGSEENAAGRLAVTAPTLGSAGTVPAIAYVMKHHLKLSRDAMRKGLLAAGLVGFLCKSNASVAGAEVGCQGEIGVASSMAAAMISYATGASLEATEIAATMALEHHLGMSCDPVGGLVLIPCIERNAFGAVKAYNAYLLATSEMSSRHWEDLDRVVAAMYETGKALPAPFKETGMGGLGVSMIDC